MRNMTVADSINGIVERREDLKTMNQSVVTREEKNNLPELLFITSYPPRECGIATYSQDLIKALNNKFNNSFAIKICPLETESEKHNYTDEIKYILNTDHPEAFSRMATTINANTEISMVMIQHEFGFFENKDDDFKQFLETLTKPVVIVFHTVLPKPDELLKLKVQQIAAVAESIIVMTNNSAEILMNDYDVPEKKNYSYSAWYALSSTFRQKVFERKI